MKRIIAALLLMLVLTASFTALSEAGMFSYRFADASEAAELLLSNREYYEGMSQNDLNFRLQKTGATLEELEAFAAAQTLDFTDDEKAAIDEAMAAIEEICRARGYILPATDGIVFAKTTMAEECDAGAYTHGTQIYLGQSLLEAVLGYGDLPVNGQYLQTVIAHELFHCLTRCHPEFRRAMYGILGFTVEDEDFVFSDEIREAIISNPDVEHHNAWAIFDIGGRPTKCVTVFTTIQPFKQPGDNFFVSMATGLVPIDDLSTMYTSVDAGNFWEVFGRNTGYVIDPEEALADNFSNVIVQGPNARYETPRIVEAIDACLRAGDY